MADESRLSHRSLLEAAEKLGAVLDAYQRAAHGFLKFKLDSRKSVAKAAEGLAQIARIDDELSAEVGRLVGAIAQVRDGQQGIAEAVQRRALDVLERKEALQSLLGRLEQLAADVRDLGGVMPEDREPTGDDLARLTGRIGQLSDAALAFAADAQSKDFADLAAEGQALRQQLLSVANRTARLGRRNPSA